MQKIRMHPFVQAFGLVVLCLALGSGTALANHHHGKEGHHGKAYSHHTRGDKARALGVDMFAYVPAAILFQKDLLELSDQQVQKIQSIRQEMRKTGPDRQAIKKIHKQMAAAFREGEFDLSAYKSALQKAADYLVQANLQTARNAQEALQVLNQDQRTRFLYTMQVIHEWVETHGMKYHHGLMDDDEMEAHDGMGYHHDWMDDDKMDAHGMTRDHDGNSDRAQDQSADQPN